MDRGTVGQLEEMLLRRGNYQALFILYNGAWPHPCIFCNELVEGYTKPLDGRAAVVHHRDRDRANNTRENLAPCHFNCHFRYHNPTFGHVKSPQHRTAIGNALRGKPKSPAHRKAIRERQWYTPEIGAKMSAAAKERRVREPYLGFCRPPGWTHDEKARREIGIKSKYAAERWPVVICNYCFREVKGWSNLIRHERACREWPGSTPLERFRRRQKAAAS